MAMGHLPSTPQDRDQVLAEGCSARLLDRRLLLKACKLLIAWGEISDTDPFSAHLSFSDCRNYLRLYLLRPFV